MAAAHRIHFAALRYDKGDPGDVHEQKLVANFAAFLVRQEETVAGKRGVSGGPEDAFGTDALVQDPLPQCSLGLGCR